MTFVQKYPASTLAAVVALVAIAAGVILFVQDGENLDRAGILVTLIGGIVTTILATQRGEAATNAARRADEGVQAAKTALDDAIASGEQTTPAALAALTRLLEQTAPRIENAAAKVEAVANGHAAGELHTRAGDVHPGEG